MYVENHYICLNKIIHNLLINFYRQSTSDSNNEDSSTSLSMLTPINFEKAMRDREKELIQREAQLKAYQEQVIKVEKLAEDATRIALEEKEMRLRKLAEELRNREAIGKKCNFKSIQKFIHL